VIKAKITLFLFICLNLIFQRLSILDCYTKSTSSSNYHGIT